VSIRGDDPWQELSTIEKDAMEAKLRADARLSREGKRKEASARNRRAAEISRRKSRRAHQGTD
jgi:hypothetical protein